MTYSATAPMTVCTSDVLIAVVKLMRGMFVSKQNTKYERVRTEGTTAVRLVEAVAISFSVQDLASFDMRIGRPSSCKLAW